MSLVKKTSTCCFLKSVLLVTFHHCKYVMICGCTGKDLVDRSLFISKWMAEWMWCPRTALTEIGMIERNSELECL